MTALVLSLFPGIGLLDRGFEDEGFCVVRGPDLLWGGDVKKFHVPAGRFDGVIGGPPCKRFSQANQAARKGIQPLAEDLIPEFVRIVSEAAPAWFCMENVRQAPVPEVHGYATRFVVVNNRNVPATPGDSSVGAVQNRVRRFTMGLRGEVPSFAVRLAVFENRDYEPCFTANATQWDSDGGRSRSSHTRKSLRRGLRAQGLPEDMFDETPWTVEGAIAAVGNGVPYPLARAVARAVREAMEGCNVR